LLNRALSFLADGGAQPTQPTQADALPSAGRDIAVTLARTNDEFAGLAPEWNRLHDKATVASVFTSWVWQFNWWQVYGAGQPLRILVASQGGDVVGILPLYVQAISMLGVPVRLLRLVGTGGDTHPDDLGTILDPVRGQAAALQLARAALRLRDGDVLLLSDLAADCPLRAAVESEARLAGRAVLAGVSEKIAFVRLPRTWDAYLQSLSSHHRLGVRYKRRKATRSHAVRFFVWEDPARLDSVFDRLAELHRRRWQASGGSTSFSSAQYLEFHRRVMKACLPRGWLRLYCLELDGEIAAIVYCYRFRNVVYCMQSGFDPGKGKLKLGSVLLGHAFEHAIGEGNHIFDFLRGEHGYKDQLATDYRSTFCVRVFRATPGGLAYRLRRVWLPVLKARLLRQSPPALKP
jgi:CelD/BcsL family acetyltransferase involved in cellulose biosynthesis